MSKNAKKKAKFKEVTFTITKNKFKNLLSLILKHIASTRLVGNSILNGVKLCVSGNIITLAATDGNTLLELETKLDESVVNNVEAVLVGVHLEKIALKKDYYAQKNYLSVLDVLEITVQEKQTVIKDVRNNVIYNIPHYDEENQKYPEYKKLFPDTDKNKDYNKIGVNMALLSKLSALTQRGIPSILYVNKNPLSAIIVKADYDGIKSRAIVMPIQIRE